MMSEEYYRNKIAKYQAKLGDIQVDVVDDVNPKDVMEGAGNKTYKHLSPEDEKKILDYLWPRGDDGFKMIEINNNYVTHIKKIRECITLTDEIGPIKQRRYAVHALNWFKTLGNDVTKPGILEKGEYSGKFSSSADDYKLNLVESLNYKCKTDKKIDNSVQELNVCYQPEGFFSKTGSTFSTNKIYEVIPVKLYLEELAYAFRTFDETEEKKTTGDNPRIINYTFTDAFKKLGNTVGDTVKLWNKGVEGIDETGDMSTTTEKQVLTYIKTHISDPGKINNKKFSAYWNSLPN